ncbi:MAG: hypothetical protein ACRD4K_11135 [Candidatus Acidiferrales bacterium]
MRKRVTVVAAIALILLLALWYLWGPSTVPPGQERVVTLSQANFGEFEKSFDTDSDFPRLVLLLSPT